MHKESFLDQSTRLYASLGYLMPVAYGAASHTVINYNYTHASHLVSRWLGMTVDAMSLLTIIGGKDIATIKELIPTEFVVGICLFNGSRLGLSRDKIMIKLAAVYSDTRWTVDHEKCDLMNVLKKRKYIASAVSADIPRFLTKLLTLRPDCPTVSSGWAEFKAYLSAGIDWPFPINA